MTLFNLMGTLFVLGYLLILSIAKEREFAWHHNREKDWRIAFGFYLPVMGAISLVFALLAAVAAWFFLKPSVCVAKNIWAAGIIGAFIGVKTAKHVIID